MINRGNCSPVVMVVEDDVEMNELERELLAVYGFETLPAYTGTEAVAISRKNHPDAVLLDVMLPEMDGFETCWRLIQQENYRHLPVIIVSALAEDESRRRGYASGASAYFTKPFDPDEVVATLRKLIALDRVGHAPPRG